MSGGRKTAGSFQRRSRQYCNHDHFLICILIAVATTTNSLFDPTEPQYEFMQMMVPLFAKLYEFVFEHYCHLSPCLHSGNCTQMAA